MNLNATLIKKKIYCNLIKSRIFIKFLSDFFLLLFYTFTVNMKFIINHDNVLEFIIMSISIATMWLSVSMYVYMCVSVSPFIRCCAHHINVFYLCNQHTMRCVTLLWNIRCMFFRWMRLIIPNHDNG